MSGTVHKELRTLLAQCEAAGCQVTQTRRNHLRIIVPGGGIVIVSGTPSSRRALQNAIRDLRRAGLDITKHITTNA